MLVLMELLMLLLRLLLWQILVQQGAGGVVDAHLVLVEGGGQSQVLLMELLQLLQLLVLNLMQQLRILTLDNRREGGRVNHCCLERRLLMRHHILLLKLLLLRLLLLLLLSLHWRELLCHLVKMGLGVHRVSVSLFFKCLFSLDKKYKN